MSCLTFTSTAVTDSMTLTKTNSPAGAVNMGDTITYTLTYKNTGAENATGVVITDTIPANTTFVPGSISSIPLIAMVTQTANTISWTVGNLLPGVSGTLSFQVKIASCGTGTISNKALETDFVSVCGSTGLLSNVVTNTINGCIVVTPTNTSTPTQTNTPTVTNTRTNTFTPTATFTQTNTITPTNTPTPLVSNTPTNTYTVTNTPTVTNTRTNTNTPTNTMTPTSTRTPTNTYTATNTPTVTNTFTITNTRTNTPTYTETRTPTDTPTITPTMPVVPFVIKLGLYNEAGELVGYIGTVGSEKSCTGIDMLLAGKSANTVLSGSNVTISLAGTQVPGGAAGDMDALSWHVDSAAAQEIATGAYIIKAEQKDMYDHVIVVTKSITIIKSEEYVEMKIFNSAGELVNTYRQYVSVDDKFLSAMSLETKSSYIVGANKKAEVGYASGMYFEWDGRNAHGILVESGVYEIQITGKTASGQSMVASKTVTVISENTEKLFEEASSYPNPVKVNETVNFVWHSLSTGRMTVRIYNISGEKIATVAGMINSGKITWNGKTSHGDTAATGVYVCMLEAISDDGRIYREKVKIAVAGKKKDGVE